MPTVRSGPLATGGTYAVNPDQIPVEMHEEVFQYDGKASPVLLVVTGPRRRKMQVKKTDNPTFKLMEDDVLPEADTSTASFTNVATQILVTNPAYHRAGDLIRIPRTGEAVRVVSVNEASSTLTVTRAWGGAGTAGNNGELLVNLGAAEMEGDLSPVAKATVTVTKEFYCQIVKTPIHITGTADATMMYSGDELDRQRRKAGEKHARLWEQICLHGVKKLDTTTGIAPIRSAGGLDEHITTNVLDVSATGTATEAEFIDWIGDCMRFSVRPGNTKKGLLCSREVAATISSWGNNKIQTNPGGSKTLGFSVGTYICPFGELDIINHPLLEGAYAGYAYMIDWDGIMYRPLRRTLLERDIQLPGEDARKDQYRTEAGFAFALEKTFGKSLGWSF